MNTLAQALMSDVYAERLLVGGTISQYSATDIREAIAALVGQNHMTLASALCDAGLSLYPQDENVLSMAALVAQVNQDWAQADQHLSDLMAVQGESATAFTWNLRVRTLRCLCEPVQALVKAREGLCRYPNSEDLQREVAELEALLGESAFLVTPVLQRQ